MEAEGINADQNFYSRRSNPSASNEHHNHTYNPSPLPAFEQTSPQRPLKITDLTTQNLAAAGLNGYASGTLNGHFDRDPDDFYREYRGVQTATGSYTDITQGNMAATFESRPAPSTLRSNANGTTPKHPILPLAQTTLKPSYRSASSPLDHRPALGNAKTSTALNGYAGSRQPSVKDLLKRFDQNNEPSTATTRKLPGRINTKEVSGSGYAKDRFGYQTRATNPQTGATTSRAGSATREVGIGRVKSPTTSRSTQRTRFAVEDTHSNNTLSGTARTIRARNVSGSNYQASRSMTNLSPTSPTAQQTVARRPLFGEVTSMGHEVGDIGYGISRAAATRRTSDSNLHPSWAHGRRRSDDADISPSSPTAWYLGVTPSLDDVETNRPSRVSGHNRNHSDFQDTKVNTMNGVKPSFHTSSSPTTSATQHSRLPVPASKRNSNSSESITSSQSSTRANSPLTTKAVSNGRLRRPSEQAAWAPASGPSITSTGRARTPTRNSHRGKITDPSPSKGSLKAYISAPPPKTSPPLRSSRPRQPVSSAASTAASKTKTADQAGSPQRTRTGMKLTRTGGDSKDRKERNILNVQLTAQDFAERRETIRRAYTKSIHESEQKQIRADNLRRLNERHQHSRSSVSTVSQATETGEEPHRPLTPPPSLEQNVKVSSPEPLRINTAVHAPQHKKEQVVVINQDSPTLGVPGTFVEDDDEPPQSAVSCATGITDIDNEPQTEPPEPSRLHHMTSRPDGFSSHINYLDGQLSAEQALFGVQSMDLEESIQIMLDATPLEEQKPEATPTNDQFAHDPLPPGAFQEEVDSVEDECPPVFASTVTSASPPRESNHHFRIIDPFQQEDDDELVQGQERGHDRLVSEDAVVSESSSETQSPPEITFPDDVQYAHVPDSTGVPRLELPTLRTALRPVSAGESENGQDYLGTPLTDMEYESSDGVGVMNLSRRTRFDHVYDSPREGQVSPRTYRSSNRSSWTDYAIDTVDEYPEQETHAPISPPFEPERAPTPPPKELRVSPVPPPKDDGYSPQPSPRASHYIPHELPVLSTGDGLGLGFSDDSSAFGTATLTATLWPEYSPPPVPDKPNELPLPPPTRTPPLPNLYNMRPPSSLYESSQSGAPQNNESRRASDDLYSARASNSTPRSSTQISFDDAVTDKLSKAPSLPVNMTEEEKEAAEKNRKRLFHRKMVIKELIDTESIYLKDMNVVEEIYKGTAEACPKLDSGDVKTIFRNTNEIVQFSTMFLDELKSAASSVYSPRTSKARQQSRTTPSTTTTGSSISPSDNRLSVAGTLTDETDEHKDRQTFIGANFGKHLQRMQVIYTEYLKNSENASTRLAVLQGDGAVKVWLSECNLVAKDLTQAWDLDALLVKPVQRITRYQLLLTQIRESTPSDHPDFDALQAARTELSSLLANIDALKKRIQMVGQIVGRKRKESDVRSGLAKAFGRREKVQANPNRPHDDEAYLKSHERFGDDYLRLQVVLRDVEFYTRETTTYVTGFLRYLSSMELMMRLGASPFPEIESKWVRFNLSMRDVESVAMEDHISKVRKKVIEPFEQIIALYGPPGLAMKKRNKRRLDYEKSLSYKGQGKKIDEKLAVLVSEYEALNETLKLELPKLSSLTETIGNICCIQLVHLQAEWWSIWQTKLRAVLEESQVPKDAADIVDMFHRDYKYNEARLNELGIVNGTFGSGAMTRQSTHSTQDDRGRPSDLSARSRGLSINSERSPVLPNSDFTHGLSGQLTFSPFSTTGPGLPQFAYQPQSYSHSHSRAGSGSPATPDTSTSQRHHPYPPTSARPGTGRSFTSDSMRMSTDYNTQHRRESGSTYNSAQHHVDGPPMSARPYSGIFHSAMPMQDGPGESQRSSRASSRDRSGAGTFNVLYLAASLFEFNISATKQEAGYPYLTYQAGEIFDVIAEKGELWLAKNQDDPTEQVGWIWSKHFARLATD